MQWSLVQKGQTHVVDAVDAVNFGSKRSNPFSGHSMQWMQYTVDAVE